MANLRIQRWCESLRTARSNLRLSLSLLCCLIGSAEAQETERNGSPIRVEYTVAESSPAGTVIGVLADQYPHVKNFRISAGNRQKAFTVDSASGTIIVQNPGALDFERRAVHRLTVRGDAEASREDAFLDEFRASLLEEGVSSGDLDQLTSAERRISVSIRLLDVPESTPTSAGSVTDNIDPIVAEPTIPATIAATVTAPGVAVTVIDAVPANTEAVASSPTEVPLADLIHVSETPPVSEVPPASTSSAGPSDESNSSRMYTAVCILLILVAAAATMITVLLRRTSNARKSAIILQDEKNASKSKAATAIKPKSIVAGAVEEQARSCALKSFAVAATDQCDNEASARSEATCVANAYQKVGFPSAELTRQMPAGDRRVDALVGQHREESGPSVAAEHESEFDDSSVAESDRHPEAASRRRDDYGFDDSSESLARARSNLEQTMQRHHWTSAEQFSQFAVEQSESAVATLAPVENLRTELRDLFAIYGQSAPSGISPPVEEPTGASEPEAPAEALDSDVAHQDSITRYLSDLLDRKKDDIASESLSGDRRKSNGKSDSAERRGERAVAPERKPVKSYLESYMKEHGGQLKDDNGESGRSAGTLLEVKPVPDVSAEPPVERTPVDVSSIREDMTSFRNVAMRSVEHALALHSLRKAQGALAFRKLLLVALLLISVFIVAANMLQAIHVYPLNWLMGVILVLCCTELCLRMQSLRHRRKLMGRAATLQPDAGSSEDGSPANSDPVPLAG